MNSNDEQLDVPTVGSCPKNSWELWVFFWGQFQEIEIDSDHLQKRSTINDDILWYSMIFDMLPYFPKNSYDTPWFTFIADSLSWTLSVFSSLTLILWVFITISWSFGTFSGHNWPGALITGPFNGWETLQQTSHCDDMNTPTQKTLVLEAKSP